mmetsp:Transcript_13780/g.25964  ORF Transcript_13780/g.25964 Transcript_13780/m.25964 type:complete len:149 (-) Transcript_13780:1480-1926(-)
MGSICRKQYHQLILFSLVFFSISISIFQLVLALGVPLGKAAWGGSSSKLSTTLRVASGISCFLWAFISHLLCIKTGLVTSNLFSETFVNKALNFLFYLLMVSCVMNWISQSLVERYIWGPVTTWMVFSLWYLRREEGNEYNVYQTIDS